MREIYFGLGSNLGSREETIQCALTLMDERIGTQERCSSYFYSEPWGFDSPNEFCNIVVCYRTEKSLLDVLHITQQIECELGRQSKSHDGVYHDRPIDIDLLLCFEDGNSISYQSEELVLPHPHIGEREFVLVPLKEILRWETY